MLGNWSLFVIVEAENSENKLSVHSEIDVSLEEGKDSRIGAVYVVEGRNTL